MTDYGIKPEWAQAWEVWFTLHRKRGRDYHDAADLADLVVHLLAGWMESEFRREHRQIGVCERAKIQPMVIDGESVQKFGPCDDPRHNYDHAAWLEAARKVMEEMGR